MIKKFKQFINSIEYLKYLKESEEYTKYIPFPDSDKKILQSRFNLLVPNTIIISKTVKDAIWSISKYGYFYILVGQILKDNKRDPKTDETLTKIKNDIISGVEQIISPIIGKNKLRCGQFNAKNVIYIDKDSKRGVVNQYMRFFISPAFLDKLLKKNIFSEYRDFERKSRKLN